MQCQFIPTCLHCKWTTLYPLAQAKEIPNILKIKNPINIWCEVFVFRKVKLYTSGQFDYSVYVKTELGAIYWADFISVTTQQNIKHQQQFSIDWQLNIISGADYQ